MNKIQFFDTLRFMSIDVIKNNIGASAAALVEPGMVVGLGTGSTAAYFVKHLIERCRQGLKIHAIASSQAISVQAAKGGIPLLDPHAVSSLDLTIDGADEIDALKQMIKGAGGALVREKILASMSREMIVIVDESKLVAQLGKAKLPVEVIPFGHLATLHHIQKLGLKATLRKAADNSPFITDNGNYIYDIYFEAPRSHPEQDHETLIRLPGVVDTGFFFHLAGRVIIGFFDGQIVTRN
jgi:ribose 5-phosphate isomerase A